MKIMKPGLHGKRDRFVRILAGQARLAKFLVFGVALLFVGSSAFADVQVTMRNGRVSIVAKDATLRQILTEWARVGQTKIVNVERIPGGPISIELIEVSEEQALDVLLRSLAGYISAPRAAPADNLSRFDRVIVMPTLASARPAPSSAPPPPVFQQPQFPQPPPADNDDDPAPGLPGQNPANPRGPVFNAFPPPQVVNPQGGPGGVPPQGFVPPTGFPQAPQVAQPSNMPTRFPGPTSPAGVAVPGMIVQPPPQPGQPGVVQPPGQPGVPVRRPGGQR